MSAKRKVKPVELLKLDLGCGKTPREGFIGVDSRDFGQPAICDLSKPKWVFKQQKKLPPFGVVMDSTGQWILPDNSVEEVNCSHFVEHLTGVERVHFANELYRVLIPGGKASIVVPHWNSPRAYGDLTHQWPPVSEWWFLYLNKGWRESQAPHNDQYTCDFDITYGYSLRPDIAARPQEYQQYAMANYKDAAQDIVSNWVAKKG